MSQNKKSLSDRLEGIRDYCAKQGESVTILFHGDGTLSAFLEENNGDDPDVDAADLEDLVDELESILDL